MNKWTQRFLQQARLVASWSKDPSTKVGAIISDGNRVVSQGFNGYPTGLDDHDMNDREIKYLKTIHAEENAILFANRDLTGCTIHVTHLPCPNCTAKIIQVGIKHVVAPRPDADYLSRWGEKVALSLSMFTEAGVKVEQVDIIDETNS